MSRSRLLFALLVAAIIAAPSAPAQTRTLIAPTIVPGVPVGAIGPTAPGAWFPTPTGAPLGGVWYDAAGPAIYVVTATTTYEFVLPLPLVGWTWSGAGLAARGIPCWDELVMWDGTNLLDLAPILGGTPFRIGVYRDPAWTGALPTLVGLRCTQIKCARIPSTRAIGYSTVCGGQFNPAIFVGLGVPFTLLPALPALMREAGIDDGVAMAVSGVENVGLALGQGDCCIEPAGPQAVETLFAGTTFYANTTPPDYGVSLDPGTALRFDLHVDIPIRIESIGVNLLNDGGTYAGVPVPNLVGAANGTMEVWISGPPDTVNNAALFTGNAYTHLPPPGVPPIAPWVQLSNPATHLDNLAFASPDLASTGTFAGGLALGAGDYAVVVVLVPPGVAGPSGAAANPATDRIHPLFTNLNTIPGPSSYGDQFVMISNPGVQSPAFVNGALSPASATPYMPNLRIEYSLQNATTAAYSTPYGAGCYDRKRSFYESWAAPGSPSHIDIDPVGSGGAIHGLDLIDVGANFVVTLNPAPGLFVAPGSTAGAIQLNALPPALTTGGWDDATSGPIPLPFPFPYPGDGGAGATAIDVSSNGICYLAPATSTFGFYDGFAGFLGNQPAIAAAWCDFEPADLFTFLGGTGDLWVDVDPLGQWVAVTWDGVQVWNEPTNLSTVQLVLHNGGGASIRYGAGGVTFSAAPVLVGFTPGNGAPDPGAGSAPRQAPDLSVAAGGAGYLSGDGAVPATLRLPQRPRVGAALILDTDTSNATAGTIANLTILSANPLDGVDLAPLGMGGCDALVALPELLSDFQFGAGPFQWNVTGGATLPPAVVGARLYAQSVQFVASTPPLNAANLLVSDAVCMQIHAN
ncbi:MAG: hypothetical protein AB7O97_21325 [Planctomycetota bacterium]